MANEKDWSEREERGELHARYGEMQEELEALIDRLKSLGPDSQDHWNALTNIQERLRQLNER